MHADAGLLTAEEVAKLLGVRPATIRQWRWQRRLPAVKLGRAVRFRREDIEAIVQRRLEKEIVAL
jgi:excisionase family DNA binding protein